MRVAIVGGGISGLATYLNLHRDFAKDGRSLDITIYETHDLRHLAGKKPSEIPSHGGGYGLAANGMASLRRLDPAIHEQILRNGFPAATCIMRSARGWTLGVMDWTDKRGENPECLVMVLREIVIQALYERIPASAVVHEQVIQVEDGDQQAVITLGNGEEQTYDLVIGADGVWSKARGALLGDQHGPEYKGLFTVGGFVSTDCLPAPTETGQEAHGQVVMIFGPNGFFAHTPYTTGSTQATKEHVLGNATLPAGKMAFWWSRSAQKDPSANPDEAALKSELEKRHESWKGPTIRKIMQNSDVRLKIPTYVLAKIPTWAGKRIVLVGDAAHALPSSSGQGVSQSLEDAEALSILLAHNLDRNTGKPPTNDALSKTFKQYMSIRKAHVEKILDAGNRAGDTSREMGTVGEMTMYGAMWLIFKLFGAFWMKELKNYDVVAEVDKIKAQS